MTRNDFLIIGNDRSSLPEKDQLGQGKEMIPNAWHGIMSRRHVLKAVKRTEIAESFFCDFCDCDAPIADPRNRERFLKQEKAMPHCDLRVRWKVASDLRFRAAISEPQTPSFCGISGGLAQSTRKSLAIAMVRFWCAKFLRQ